jgi:hypothetical protein
MRYYCYNELADDGSSNLVITMSEDDIRRDYYPYWYDRMCKKFGKEEVDTKYSFEDCLTDWLVVNWAWESTE